MKNTGKSLMAAALILTVLTVTLFALPIFADTLRSQTQERGDDCPQTCEPSEDCEPNKWDYNYNYKYKDCGDCDCDGTMKQTRTGLQTC